MPRLAKPWTKAQVERTCHSGRGTKCETHAVGVEPGLYLQVSATGAKSWIMRYSFAGRRRELGLGRVTPFNHLDAARKAAGAARAMLLAVPPVDPLAVKHAKAAEAKAEAAARMTFAEAASACLAQRRSGFNSAAHEATWWAPIPLHVLPALGGRPVASIGIGDVVDVLTPIWLDKYRTATLVRGRMEAILDWAISNAKRPGPNPAAWDDNLKHRLPAVSKAMRESDARPAVQVAEVARWYGLLCTIATPAAAALRAVALTALRSGEARGMEWRELDESAGVWTVPASRMKMKIAHEVPISPQLATLLESQRAAVYDGLHRGSPLVFPATRGGVLSDLMISDTMRKVHAMDVAAGGGGFFDKATGLPAVPHGLRATFKGWAQETRVPWDLSEHVLAHKIGNAVSRAYDRDTLVDLRRPVMAEWAGMLTGTTPVNPPPDPE